MEEGKLTENGNRVQDCYLKVIKYSISSVGLFERAFQKSLTNVVFQ